MWHLYREGHAFVCELWKKCMELFCQTVTYRRQRLGLQQSYRIAAFVLTSAHLCAKSRGLMMTIYISLDSQCFARSFERYISL